MNEDFKVILETVVTAIVTMGGLITVFGAVMGNSRKVMHWLREKLGIAEAVRTSLKILILSDGIPLAVRADAAQQWIDGDYDGATVVMAQKVLADYRQALSHTKGAQDAS